MTAKEIKKYCISKKRFIFTP